MFFSYKSMSRTDFLPGTFALHWCFLQPMWKFTASSVDGFLGPMNPWNFTLKCVCVHVCVRVWRVWMGKGLCHLSDFQRRLWPEED